MWQPSTEDLELLLHWLTQKPLSHLNSQLSRIVLSHLHWGLNPTKDSLVLPYHFHHKTALAIVKTSLNHAPEVIFGESLLQSGVRQVSNIASVVRQSPEPMFASWAWSMVSMLRLHAVDMEDDLCAKVIDGNPTGFQRVIDYHVNRNAKFLEDGLSQRNPLAVFVILQATNLGHSIPEICNQGFDLLKLLLGSGRYSSVTECLFNISPLFFANPDDAIGHEQFLEVIQAILLADKTLVNAAKDIVYREFPSVILSEFGNMINKQITSFQR